LCGIYIHLIFTFEYDKRYYHELLVDVEKNYPLFKNQEKYKDIFKPFCTFRSLNTYSRQRVDDIIKDTIYENIQNDKIFLYNYLYENNFKIAQMFAYIRSSDEIDRFMFQIKALADKGVKLVVKASHLSYSEGVFLINAPLSSEQYQNTRKRLVDIMNTNVSITDGGGMTGYENKKGILIQENVDNSDIYCLNEWKIMYVWGVPFQIFWKLDNTKFYKKLLSNMHVIWENNKYKNAIKNEKGRLYYKQIPSFAMEMIAMGRDLAIKTNAPFVRVDFLWNEKDFILNETELIPSDYLFPEYEYILMKLIKHPYRYEKNSCNKIYESYAYAYFIFHLIEYWLFRALHIKSLYTEM
jgi:hypothetical protein